MSYYFAIIGTQDNPLFEHEFGTSKQGGDGQSRFAEQANHMNQFIVHSSLDIVEEVQWGNGQMCAGQVIPQTYQSSGSPDYALIGISR
jgi:trafficking protein particle complex subunit 2